ncbi:uncharacterized protein LOC143504700 [Brachyhypopomus gauderio]|uniref:uncharacterized protein LOC143504700 n=1 Tax=Brachyhypopomus gauderio TaxID=698409 RepID=UPI004042B00C
MKRVFVCRLGILLKALNMFRGEIFAYPLFLQKELHAATNAHFYCTDIACRYWPYLEKVAISMPELGSLLQMSPFLSVMHAKAHSTKCEIVWSGRPLDGAGTTAGEEVEMMNSYLSRCALTTKYMTKSAGNDMPTVHAIGWNLWKQISLHLSLSSRYIKTVRRTEMANKKLEDLCSELGCPENRVLEWVRDVRLWATDDSIHTSCSSQHALQHSIERFLVCIRKKQVCIITLTATRFIICGERN